MKTFYLTIVFEVGVTVEQEEDWLNDPTIAKTILLSELSKEEIKRIKRTIDENVVWFRTDVTPIKTEKATQNNNLFTFHCQIATDDIDRAIRELKKYFENSYDGKWVNSDREFRTIEAPEQYDNEVILYNLDLVLKSVEYKEGEEIDVEKYLAERLAKINFATWELPTVGQPSLSFNPEPIGPLPDLQFNLPNLGYGNVNQGLPNLGIIQSPNLAIMQSPPLQRWSTQEAQFQGLPAPFQGLPALLQSPPLQRRSV